MRIPSTGIGAAAMLAALLISGPACGSDGPAAPEGPASIRLIGRGDGQVAIGGRPINVVVHVEDRAGLPSVGATVNFAVTGGGGSVPASAVTDDVGAAEVVWTLGAPGAQTLTATVDTVSPLTVNAMATVALVAVGGGGTGLVTSMDGVSWTERTHTIGLEVDGVAWNGRLWTAVGREDDLIATSPDGIEWTARVNPFEGTVWAVAAGETLWVAAGDQGAEQGMTIATSPDGVTWTARVSELTESYGVATDGTRWIVAGYSDTSSARAVTSTDGITWTRLDVAVSLGSGVATNGQMWLIGDFNTGSVYTSTNGQDFTARATGLGFSWRAHWNGSLWAVAGNGGVARSANGIDWTVSPVSGMTSAYGIVWDGTQWIVGGYGTTVLATSPDGITWTPRTVPEITYLYDVAFAYTGITVGGP